MDLKQTSQQAYDTQEKENYNGLCREFRDKFSVLGYELPKTPLDIKYINYANIVVDVEGTLFWLLQMMGYSVLRVLPTLVELCGVLDDEWYAHIQDTYNPLNKIYYSYAITSLVRLGKLFTKFELESHILSDREVFIQE